MWGRKKSEKSEKSEKDLDANLSLIIKEAKGPDEILSIGVSMVTSAIAARNTDNIDKRMKQYSDDLSMFMSEMNPIDTIVLNSFMADFAASLVLMISEATGVPADECMSAIARAAHETSTILKKFGDE